MALVNENFLKLQAKYLFSDIAKKVKVFKTTNPKANLIRMGIGDVTQPLAPACIEAMKKAVEEKSASSIEANGYNHQNEPLVEANEMSSVNISNPHDYITSMIPVLQSRKLTSNDVKGLDKTMLRLLRNAMFAAHNYKFKSPDLMEFYTYYSWYSPLYEDVSSSLNSIERYNIDFIKRRE